MKKFFILLTGFSILFFSCASKTTAEPEETVTAPVEDTISPVVEETPAENQDSQNTDKEVDDVEYLTEEAYLAELEELADPEVTDVEYVEAEASDDEQNTKETETDFELVPQEEVLAVTETPDVKPEQILKNSDEVKNKTEKNTNNKSVKTQDDDEIIDLTENNSPEDILEILDDCSDSTPEEAEPLIIIPSRKVTLKIGQTLEVVYPGSGWIYMGTTDSTKDFTFLGKKLGTQNTKFTFTTKSEGSKILHFYKNDSLTENYIDDYLEVEILNVKDAAKLTVSAPSYKQPVPKKEVNKVELKTTVTKKTVEETKKPEVQTPPKTQTAASKENAITNEKYAANETKVNNVKPAVSTKPTATEQTDEQQHEEPASLTESEVSDLLKQAHLLYENKNYKEALNKLNQFFEYSTKKRDEAFFLQGQIYEAAGTTKNIKLAIEAYKNVTKNYPASPYWDDANKRIIYLTKFYLEGR